MKISGTHSAGQVSATKKNVRTERLSNIFFGRTSFEGAITNAFTANVNNLWISAPAPSRARPKLAHQSDLLKFLAREALNFLLVVTLWRFASYS